MSTLNGCNCHMPGGGHIAACASRRPPFNNGATLVAMARQDAAQRERIRRLEAVLDAVYLEANEGTDDSHRRLCNIMRMINVARHPARTEERAQEDRRAEG
jgi:secreted trypsin-like serine protease